MAGVAEAAELLAFAAITPLVAEADFLRNADDKRDWNAAPGTPPDTRATSDRFVLELVKP